MAKRHTETEQIWRKRIEAAKSFPGSIKAYCRSEKIQTTSFYSWRRRFEAETAATTRRGSAFVATIVDRESPSTVPKRDLPDAKWLGEVISHILGGLR